MTQTSVLEQAVDKLVLEYSNKIQNFSVEDFLKADVDPFRFAFNVQVWGLKDAIRREIEHKIEMGLEDLFGDFHQNYLGNALHQPSQTKWSVIPNGKLPGIDISNPKIDAYLQLKSKHNSMNSSSAKRLAKELGDLSKIKKGCTVGCGWVVAGDSRKCIGEGDIEAVAKVLKGKDLFAFVTGNEKEMDEVIRDFPKVLSSKLKSNTFSDLIDEATARIMKSLEDKAKMQKVSVPEYLYRLATR